MATVPSPPAADLAETLAAVEAAYQRLSTADHPDPRLVAELHRCADDLARATDQRSDDSPVIRLAEPATLPMRLRRRYCAVGHGARWITDHFG